jgi:hypothetical protein
VDRPPSSPKNPARPLGTPTPVGPSQPLPALHSASSAGEQDRTGAFWPKVTSVNAPAGAVYIVLGPITCERWPPRAYRPAMNGDEALVPPTVIQLSGCPVNGAYVSYTATPVAGSATADTSDDARWPPQTALTEAGAPMAPGRSVSQPLPAPAHTLLV